MRDAKYISFPPGSRGIAGARYESIFRIGGREQRRRAAAELRKQARAGGAEAAALMKRFGLNP